MYSVPESFLEIEVRNPQTHGKCCALRRRPVLHYAETWNGDGMVRKEDVHRLRDRLQGAPAFFPDKADALLKKRKNTLTLLADEHPRLQAAPLARPPALLRL